MHSEQHPLPFFLPSNARVLMLGSFPPPRIRWSMDFFYPNITNDMWRIMGLLFYNDSERFVIKERKQFNLPLIQAFLTERGIALGDTATEVIRLKNNASDQFLEIKKPIDLAETLQQMPFCNAIVVTGQKATDTILTLIDAQEPSIGSYSEFHFLEREMRLYRMPSTSRAYPLPIVQKATYYRQMFQSIGLL